MLPFTSYSGLILTNLKILFYVKLLINLKYAVSIILTTGGCDFT